VKNALVGCIEVKAPGKAADPRRFKDTTELNVLERRMTLELKQAELLPCVCDDPAIPGNDPKAAHSGRSGTASNTPKPRNQKRGELLG
jgi:hypothetical protein